MDLPRIPFMPWITRGIDWMSLNLEFLFEPVADLLDARAGRADGAPRDCSRPMCSSASYARSWRGGADTGWRSGAALALALVWNQGFWEDSIITVSLAVIGGGLALVVGIPLGVLIAENRRAYAIVLPILDYMQATPAFVYLIPWVLFFGVGDAAGIVSIFVWSTPPAVRATEVGLNGVDPRLVEAANAYGASRRTTAAQGQAPSGGAAHRRRHQPLHHVRHRDGNLRGAHRRQGTRPAGNGVAVDPWTWRSASKQGSAWC